MRFLLGLIFILALIYFLHLLLIPEEEKPEIFKTERDKTQVIEMEEIEDNSIEDESLVVARHYRKNNSKEESIEESKAENKEWGISDAGDYLLSAMKSYEEIFKSSDTEKKDKEKDVLIDTHSIEKNTDLAILIYEEMLGLDEREAR